MERRDLIKDEIERLGKVLGKIVAALLNRKDGGDIHAGLEQAQETLKQELELDIPVLLTLPEEAFLQKISQKFPSNFQAMEQLGDLFVAMGEALAKQEREKEAHVYFAKAVAIFEFITQESATFSFEREEKANRIVLLIRNQ